MNVRQVVPPDAIPSIDDPEFVGVEEYDRDGDDRVVVLDRDGEPARAYPLRYLHHHEVVNDVLGGDPREGDPGGEPVVVTWCPICGSAVAYSREVAGEVVEFGVSGKLADDDLVMYDREFGCEWKQSTGEALNGRYRNEKLDALPAAVTTVAAFRERHPDGVVLAQPITESGGVDDRDPDPSEYEDDPYDEYFEGDGFGLGAIHGSSTRTWHREDLDPKDVVLGIERDGDVLGFVRHRVEDADGVVEASVGDAEVAVFATPDGIHAFEAPGLSFEPAGGDAHFRADGAVWNGATGESDDGRELDRVPAKRVFAFAWQDDHGHEAFHGG
ncbi:hypothetical protein BRD00_10015 [Halobacteriales archaeon QS_8_69_26]|nr:MAG: hypothetical protein BRD00_10015 [Halobacteriales archaeon QS_8_69_26]